MDGARVVSWNRQSAVAGALGRRESEPELPQAQFGAVPERDGVRFRVIAPAALNLHVQLLSGAAAGRHALDAEADGVQSCFVRGAGAGDRYTYAIDGEGAYPDPASRFQPEGVHGPSEIVDPEAFRWRHEAWRGRAARELTLYELHVGTFTAAGTFNAARQRLPELQELGITAIELMPLAEFAGTRNWGYDGVCLYAPSRNYGRPDDLRAFVDAAHGLGIAVLLDVVYNHLGPEGAYLTRFYPDYMTDRHQTPWGGAINLDGPGSTAVRRFIIENAVAWITEYRLDGLRLDATHALIDCGPTHIVQEIAAAARAAAHWPVAVYAEDHRNLASLLEPEDQGGWGLDGVWADDFHHVVRRRLAGDTHGYYQDFSGSLDELARTMRQGWLFSGQYSAHAGGGRGTDASHLPMQRFVVCLQNHDQIGNRAEGDRLNHAVSAAAWRAASTLLLTSPMTPLLFMGQEWAASSPFQYFTDLEPPLGVLVTEGRRREFKDFPQFSDPGSRARIPDPQDPATFERSRLDWQERERQPHAASLALYRDLLHLRHAHRALGASEATSVDAAALDDATIVLRREQDGERFVIAVRLDGAGEVNISCGAASIPATILSTEDERYVPDPAPVRVQAGHHQVTVGFSRPGAVILKY
jgi:maltooligosyltrehalose trehalohydrolase